MVAAFRMLVSLLVLPMHDADVQPSMPGNDCVCRERIFGFDGDTRSAIKRSMLVRNVECSAFTFSLKIMPLNDFAKEGNGQRTNKQTFESSGKQIHEQGALVNPLPTDENPCLNAH